jgi:hypothetical protein
MSIDRNNTILINESNPGLTGNIKIVVEDKQNFWFSSFDNITDLIDPKFRKFRPGLSSNYALDIGRYFRQATLTDSSIWENTNLEQFKAGPEENINILFNKKYKYFAPLWISNKKIPECFVIFKTPNGFSEQNISDFDGFLNSVLLNSELVFFYDIKNNPIGTYLETSFANVQNKIYSYDDSNNLNHLYLYGLDYNIGNYINKMSIRDTNGETLTDDDLIALYKEKKLFIPNLINLEFLFDDPNDLREKYNLENYHEYFNYYGFYCDISEISRFKINLQKQNESLSFPIKYDYSELNKEEYILESFNDKTNLYIDGFIDTEFVKQSNILYFLNDKYSNKYNIYDYQNKVLTLNYNSFDLESILGYELDNFKEIPGTLLSGPTRASLLFELGAIDRNVFNNGDYLSVYSTIIPNMEWRIIASDDNCCNPGEDCYFDAPKFTFKSISFEFFDLNSEDYNYIEYLDCYHYYENQIDASILLKVNVDGILKIEEGDSILMSWTECEIAKSANFTIYGTIYDIENNITTFYLIDPIGKYFQNLGLVLELNFLYHEHSYYYSYFNPIGSIEEVGLRIEDSFNSFKNKIIETKYLNNNLIFYSLNEGQSFNRFIFKWNFTDSMTIPYNFKINGQTINGIFLYDSENKLILNSKYGRVEFFKGTNSSTKNRFYVDKTWGLENIKGNELIVTKIDGLNKLKSINIEGTLVYWRPIIEFP